MAGRGPRIDKNVASWPKPVPVKDWMGQPAVTIRAGATCSEAIELMKARRVRHLPVVDRGRLVGIVTDRDLRYVLFDPALQAKLGPETEIFESRAVRDVMTWAVISVGPQTDLRRAARLMLEDKIGALPVVDAGRVVGVLTERDVLRAFATRTPEGVVRVKPLEVAAVSEDEARSGSGRTTAGCA
jgi:acetoin utilization protein AcuB